MDKLNLSRPIITVGLLVLVGAVGAQTYYTHKLVQRVTSAESAAPMVAVPADNDPGVLDPWVAMHADMMRMQERMDRAFADMAQPGDNGATDQVMGTTRLSLQDKLPRR